MYDLEPRWMALQAERNLVLSRAHRMSSLGLAPAGIGLPGRLWSTLTTRLRGNATRSGATADEAFRPRSLARDL